METISALLDKANKLISVGDVPKAIPLYRKVIGMDAGNLTALNSLGLIYLQQANYSEAVKYLEKALKIDSKNVLANSNMGFVLTHQKKYQEALRYFTITLEVNPLQPKIWNGMAIALCELKKLTDAAVCFKQALQIDVNNIDSYIGLASINIEQKNYQEAINHLKKVTNLDNYNLKAYLALGLIAMKQENYEDAFKYYETVLSLDPNCSKAHDELGFIYLYVIRDIDKAFYHLNKSLKINPDGQCPQILLAELLLTQGNLFKGFKQHLKNRRIYVDYSIYTNKFFQELPLWRGKKFVGKRLIIGDHVGFGGFGDIIMLSRYIPLVKERGGHVTMPVLKELLRLFENFEGIDTLIPYEENAICSGEYDFHLPLVELPLIFDISLDNIPAKIPYISVNPVLNSFWQKRLNVDNKLKVGLVWESSNISKDCDFKALSLLGGIKQINYYSLQMGLTDEKVENCRTVFGSNFIDLSEHIKDFADTAAIVNNLDLVICVDTAIAHLAGALGKPVWLMLPFESSWVWLLDRNDSPWYPTMRIFRSTTPDNFSGVTKDIFLRLEMMVKE